MTSRNQTKHFEGIFTHIIIEKLPENDILFWNKFYRRCLIHFKMKIENKCIMEKTVIADHDKDITLIY